MSDLFVWFYSGGGGREVHERCWRGGGGADYKSWGTSWQDYWIACSFKHKLFPRGWYSAKILWVYVYLISRLVNSTTLLRNSHNFSHCQKITNKYEILIMHVHSVMVTIWMPELCKNSLYIPNSWALRAKYVKKWCVSMCMCVTRGSTFSCHTRTSFLILHVFAFSLIYALICSTFRVHLWLCISL
jgi:hypothetical protein